MQNIRIFTCVSFIVAGSVSGLTGCNQNVDLDAVQQYATTTAAAGASFDAFARDYGASCHRRHAYVALPFDLSNTAISLAPAYASSGMTPLQAAPMTSILAASNCVAEDQIADEWVKRNDIVLGYVRSLGALAGADNVPSFAGLGGALVTQGVVTQKQDDAFTGLLNVIALSETHAGQEDAIARAAREAQLPLRDVVDSLKIVDASYALVLKQEYESLTDTYKTRICDDLLAVVHRAPSNVSTPRCVQPTGYPPSIPVATRLRIQTEAAEETSLVDDLNARRAATISYEKALDTIVSTNDDIVKSADQKASPSEIVAVLKKHFGDLVSAVSALQQAVKK